MTYIVSTSMTIPILEASTLSNTLSIKNLGAVPFDDESSLSVSSLKLAIVDEHFLFLERWERRYKQLSEALTIGGYATMIVSSDVLQELQAKRTDSLDLCLTMSCRVNPETWYLNNSVAETRDDTVALCLFHKGALVSEAATIYLDKPPQHLELLKDLQSLVATVDISAVLLLLLDKVIDPGDRLLVYQPFLYNAGFAHDLVTGLKDKQRTTLMYLGCPDGYRHYKAFV